MLHKEYTVNYQIKITYKMVISIKEKEKGKGPSKVIFLLAIKVN